MSSPSFVSLAPRISLYTPPTHTPGHLIILCTWLGAQRKYISKYTSTYSRIAPCAKILLIESDVSILVSSYAAQRRTILSAVDIVRATLAESEGEEGGPKILLHTFSNGGPNSATQMLIVLREQLGKPVPLVGILCDSGPASGEYWKSHNAMVLSLPAGFARLIGVPVVHAILVLLAMNVAVGRYEKPEDLFRTTLLSEEHVGKKGRVCYIFSKADRMVDWRDVVAHAEVARANSWDVDEFCVEDTAHCRHFERYEREYVERMLMLWEGRKIDRLIEAKL